MPNKLIDSIKLYHNQKKIGDNGAKYLGEEISKCVTLTSLDLNLSDNNIGDNGAKDLGEGISK